jgi:lipoate-protein ligase A
MPNDVCKQNISGHVGFFEEAESMKKEGWRLLDLEYGDPYLNMAVEEAIARKVGERVAPCTIRFWRNRNTVVIGCFQSVKMEVNLKACRDIGAVIVRRFTGGGAVYHDLGNLNYALSLPRNNRPMWSDFFGAFSLSVIEALETLGLCARLKSMNTIQVNRRKIAGAAGCMRWGTIFCHGSMLVETNIEVLQRVLNVRRGTNRCRYVRSIPRRVTSLRRELRRRILIEEVKAALTKGFEKICSTNLIEGRFTEEEKRLAAKLYSKYSTNDWNFKM